LAHGFGQRYDLPVPLWLYLYGAASVVLLSFVLVGYFVDKSAAPRRYPRFNLLRVRALLGSATYATLGLVVVPLAFLGLYAGVVKLCAMLGNASFAALAGAFAYSLVPIALVYQAAHYFTYLLTEGHLIFALVSDPFG